MLRQNIILRPYRFELSRLRPYRLRLTSSKTGVGGGVMGKIIHFFMSHKKSKHKQNKSVFLFEEENQKNQSMEDIMGAIDSSNPKWTFKYIPSNRLEALMSA